MKELVLVHPVKVGRIDQYRFRESAEQSWERLANGDYVLRPAGSQEEFVLPATSVRYESRARKAAK